MNRWMVIGGAVLSAGALAVGSWRIFDQRRVDQGTGLPSSIEGRPPVAQTDTMAPVTKPEGTRRANANKETVAQTSPDESAVAKPVITSVGPNDRSAPPPVAEMPPPPPPQKIITETRPPTEAELQAIADKVAAQLKAQMPPSPPTVVVAPPAPPAVDQKLVARIQAQYDQAMQLPLGGFVVRSYPRPQPPAGRAGNGYGGRGYGVGERLVVRAGSTVYGTLDRGFNSDDPQAPMFVTVHDYLDDGTKGPLEGARLMGTIQYSPNQSAVVFNSIILANGYQKATRAIAIGEHDGRTGIGADVDYHTLSRYGGLFVSSLLQGVGQVGQQLTQANTTTTSANGITVNQANDVNWKAAGMGALAPLGQNLSTAFGQSFTRPPTITAPAGLGIGIVFVDSLTIPDGVLNQVKGPAPDYGGYSRAAAR